MKQIIFTCIIILITKIVGSQNMEGAWKLVSYNGDAIINREVIKVVQDGYFALGSKDIQDNSFLGAAGGNIKLNRGS